MLRTSRLLLRPWTDADQAPMLAMSTDPEVMRFFPAPMTVSEVRSFVRRQQALAAVDEPSLLVVEDAATGAFLGFTGLAVPRFAAAFTPCVEIGWRFRRAAWGQGFATEAASAVLDDAFARRHLEEVVSFTAPANTRSVAVMRRLGMRHDPADDFDHPALPAGHPLRRHVLLRIDAPRWAAARSTHPGTGLD